MVEQTSTAPPQQRRRPLVVPLHAPVVGPGALEHVMKIDVVLLELAVHGLWSISVVVRAYPVDEAAVALGGDGWQW